MQRQEQTFFGLEITVFAGITVNTYESLILKSSGCHNKISKIHNVGYAILLLP